MKTCQTRYQGRYLSLLEVDGWEYVSRSNATGVVVLIPVTQEGELVMVEQFRPPIGCSVIELPAGLVGDEEDPDETLLQAAKRELLEETGFEADQLEIVASFPSSAGMSDEMITFVRARGLNRIGTGGGNANEDIRVHLVALDDVDGWLATYRARGIPSDPKIYTALFWLTQ